MKEMKPFTYEDFDILYYRKNKLRNTALGLMELISGDGLSICPYMQDENGHYSEERTLATVEELLEALKTYLRFERAEEIDDAGSHNPEPQYQYYEMPEDELACYRGFVYCALRDIYANYDDIQRGQYRQVFGDLIAIASEDKVFPSFLDFLRSRYTERTAIIPQILFESVYGESTDMFAESLDRLERLKDPSYPLDFQTFYLATDEEMKQLMQSLTDEERSKVDRRIKEYEELRQAEKEWYEDEENLMNYTDETDAPDEELLGAERKLRELYDSEYAREFVRLDSYRAHLNQYLHLQHLRGSSGQFQDAVAGMVDFFLLAKGASCFADPDIFYKTIARMNRVIQQTAEMIRKKER